MYIVQTQLYLDGCIYSNRSAIFVNYLASTILRIRISRYFTNRRQKTVSSPANKVVTALKMVQSDINNMAEKYGRDPASIKLLAVSKTKPLASIEAAIQAGQHYFGENYPDEGLAKIAALAKARCEWHFIGSIQSRKAASIAAGFDWVHSVDRLKVATKLAQNRPADLPPLQICLQVNIDNEPSKSGVRPDELEALAAQCAEFPQLTLRGLMAIPAPTPDFEKQREVFARVRKLQQFLAKVHSTVDTLSMGMSQDLEAAIAEGATIVRIGTAIFGSRDRN